MAANKIPTNGGLLIGLVIKMIKAVLEIGAGIPITMVNATEMQTELDAFKGADDRFNRARSARQAASDIYQETMGAITEWLQSARNALVPKLGNRWNTAWAQAGFINASTAVPEKAEDRLALVRALESFFTAEPSYEAASLEVTAAKAKSLRDSSLSAQDELTKKAIALKKAGDDWTIAYTPLVGTIQTLIKNLEGKLGKFDPRWLAFGLNMPGTIQTPGKPQNVSAHLDETGAIIVQWDFLPLATRFRVRGMLLGVETDYSLVARSTETIAAITDVLPGQTMQIIVQGVNDNLQGVASDPIQFTVPLVGNSRAGAADAAAATAPVLEEVTISSNGNGSNANGRSNSHRSPARSS